MAAHQFAAKHHERGAEVTLVIGASTCRLRRRWSVVLHAVRDIVEKLGLISAIW